MAGLLENQNIIMRSVGDLRPYTRNSRTHSKKQIKQIAASIERFDFTNPMLIAEDARAFEDIEADVMEDGDAEPALAGEIA